MSRVAVPAWLVTIALFCGTSGVARAQALPVDLELVLAVDVSRSMDLDEQELQRRGYLEAITAPEVIAAIRAGAYGRIAVTYVEWSGPSWQQVVVPWRLIDGPESAQAFAAELAEAPLSRERWTSISSALLFAAELFERSPYQGLRRVIDVSGDGPNNAGPLIEPVRDSVLARDIVINGLPIMLKDPHPGFGSIPDLDIYYEDCVTGGPGSFVIPIREKEQFLPAIRKKLWLEVAGLSPQVTPVAARAHQKRIDCLIGEKIRMQWLDR